MSGLRGPEYVRGYRAAMKYAAEFVREAGARTYIEPAFEMLASHLEEKIETTEASAATEAKLAETYARLCRANPGWR